MNAVFNIFSSIIYFHVEDLWPIPASGDFVCGWCVSLKVSLLVEEKLFCCKPTHSLNITTFNLTQIDRWVQAFTRVMNNVSACYFILACQCVYQSL